MKLSLLLLLLLSFVWAEPEHPYNGFNHCKSDGWFCEYIGPGAYEIIFDCKYSHTQNTRIWVWTARLPDNSEKLTVRNCNTVEVHVDCTRHRRNTAIMEFSAVNVEKVVILKPSTGQQLHDNLPVPHFPPLFRLENVSETSFYSGLFQNENHSCHYNAGNMKKMILKRVGIKNIQSNAFFADIEELHWSHVKVEGIQENAMTLNGSITIEDSYINKLPISAMRFTGNSVVFRRSSIGQILPQAISVFSSVFNFTHNSVKEIMPLGLSVRSSHVNIDGNVIDHLGKEALEGISPCFYIRGSVYPISYTFTRNSIQNLSPFSLHNNWTEYEGICSTVTIDSNKFDCSCYNIVWLQGYMTDKKKLPHAGFYKALLNTTHHCGTSSNCSLSSILPYACHNESSIEASCSGFEERENFTYSLNTTELDIEIRTEVSEDFKDWDWEKSKQSDNDILYNSDQQEMVLDNTYYKDNGNELGGSKSNFPIWILVLIFVFLATLNVLAYVTFYLRRRRRMNSVDVCKYEKRGDSDNLIIKARNEGMNIECENISYQD